jgi:hypothetical protein
LYFVPEKVPELEEKDCCCAVKLFEINKNKTMRIA